MGGGSRDGPVRGTSRAVRSVTLVGAAANLALFALKLALGVAGHSRALVADAVHSLSDLATDAAILLGVRYWTAPPDEGHPHGHGRIETLLTLGLGVTLAGVAIGIAADASVSLFRPVLPPTPGVLAAALASIAIKEALYRWTVARGRALRSPALVANAWHHRSDAFSSVPVALAAGASLLLGPSWSLLDPVAALVVALLILHAAWRIAAPAAGQLVDRGVSAERREELAATARSTPGVRGVHDLRSRWVGPDLSLDLHVEVDADLTVAEGHRIADRVRRRLTEHHPEVRDVVIHVDPAGEDEER